MVSNALFLAAVSVALTSQVSAHSSIWTPTMWGFNQSQAPIPTRPQDPLSNLPFKDWWFHGQLLYPPHPDDIMQLPVGEKTMIEVACDKGVTSYYASNSGGDVRDFSDPDSPCPRQPVETFHTPGIWYLGGCALSVAYKSDINDVQPEDLVIFSVNHTCVWNLHTYFETPKDMPPCPNGKCICAWHWIHRKMYGPEQMFMNGFQCNFTGATSTQPLAKPQVPRRCGAEPERGKEASPWNCTYGAKAPLFWNQTERCNMFEDYTDTPYYHPLYNFEDGGQNDIFVNSNVTTPLPPWASPSTSSHVLARAIVDAQVTAVPTSSPSSPHSHSVATPHQSPPNEASPSPAHTSESKPSQSNAGSFHHHQNQKHKSRSSHTSRDYYNEGDEEVNNAEQSVRRAWGQHRRVIGKRHD